jgi:uncharacterized damage-inducible protein DinB
MAEDFTKAEAALKKLGQRLSAAFQKMPATARDLATVREAVRGQWEQEQQAKRTTKAAQAPAQAPKRKRQGPAAGG